MVEQKSSILERLKVCWNVLTKKNYVYFSVGKEPVVWNEDGTYNMYLNSTYMGEDMKKHFRHGLNHILRDDLYGDKEIIDIEEDLRREA